MPIPFTETAIMHERFSAYYMAAIRNNQELCLTAATDLFGCQGCTLRQVSFLEGMDNLLPYLF